MQKYCVWINWKCGLKFMENNLEKIFISLNETYPPILKVVSIKSCNFSKVVFIILNLFFNGKNVKIKAAKILELWFMKTKSWLCWGYLKIEISWIKLQYRELCKSKLSNKKTLNEKMNPHILSSTHRALTPRNVMTWGSGTFITLVTYS